MTEIIHTLFHTVDEWADRQPVNDPKLTELLNRQDALQEEIIQRLGEGGRDMMETLSGLNLELETIHDEALFRAAVQLGTELAQPRRGRWTAGLPQ